MRFPPGLLFRVKLMSGTSIGECPKPYTGYIATKFWHKKEGRWYVVLTPKKKPKRGKGQRSTSYARYLMSITLGRELDRYKEHVDHINDDKTDDRIENLQILTVGQNNRKYVKNSGKTKKIVKLICPHCKKEFEYEERNYRFHTKNGRKFFYCSRRCSGIVNGKKRNKK